MNNLLLFLNWMIFFHYSIFEWIIKTYRTEGYLQPALRKASELGNLANRGTASIFVKKMCAMPAVQLHSVQLLEGRLWKLIFCVEQSSGVDAWVSGPSGWLSGCVGGWVNVFGGGVAGGGRNQENWRTPISCAKGLVQSKIAPFFDTSNLMAHNVLASWPRKKLRTSKKLYNPKV